MKSVEELFDEFIAGGGSGRWKGEVERAECRTAFMAGAAAMGALFAAGLGVAPAPAEWPPRTAPPQCIHGQLFTERCEDCEKSGDARIMPLAAPSDLMPDGT